MKLKCWITILVLSVGLFTACTDNIALEPVDETNYVVGDGSVVGYMIDSQGKRMFTNMDFRSSGYVSFQLKVNKKLDAEVTVAMTYDETALTAYNEQNETVYELFPESCVTLADDGVVKLPVQSLCSPQIQVSFVSDASLSSTKSYVIPLRMKVVSGDLKLAEEDQTRLIFVKDLTGIPDCTKWVDDKPGAKVFSCMEVNDTNPLNNLSFTLKGSGKPLIDVVILFAANINYNAQAGRVFVSTNENVKALLDRREHYLKPLQDRGMKVILGLLGNHDHSGVGNMSKETARNFAHEVKAICDAYQLDGVFLDDEYSKYKRDNIDPGFVYPSNEAASRLCYEIKKVQPDRWVIAYVYHLTYSLPDIDGKKSGEFVDYGLHDYGGSRDLSRNYPGMPKSNMGLYSQEFNRNYWTSEANLKKMREGGYLSHMIFAMDPNRANFKAQKMAMELIAKTFYDDELVFDGIKYPKDWK